MVSIVHYALCTNPWYSLESFLGLDCGVQVQVEHHEDIMLEACRPLWRQWTCEYVPNSGSPIVEYGGAIN